MYERAYVVAKCTYCHIYVDIKIACHVRIFDFPTKCLSFSSFSGANVSKVGGVDAKTRHKRLEFAMEERLYTILKKARIVTSSPNSLVVLPEQRNGFVYIEDNDKIEDEDEGVGFFLDSEESDSNKRSFKAFLNSHVIDPSERPSMKQWLEASEAVFEVIMRLPEDDPARVAMNAYANADEKFSEIRCQKALPQAFAAYKDGLQEHYTEDLHNAKFIQAMSLFSMTARGPSSAEYADLLAQECASHWKGGRQMCEEVSLTGNGCANRRHKILADESVNGPLMPHNSSVTYYSACNCGRKQAPRDDPFTLAEANWKFYADLEEECCRELEHVAVPIWEPSRDVADEMQSLALDNASRRVVKAAEPINHILTEDESSRKSLPVFASWSLVHIGSSFLYAHNTGVVHPGFLNGAKFLHPWDIPLSSKSATYDNLKTKWPNLAECVLKRPNTELVAKAFVGFEYECPEGHRFMAQGPHKAMRMTSNSGMRDASRMLSSDMPLYVTCPACGKGAKSRPAQLMRVHIVTPKAPVTVTLMPRVQPCPDGPVFNAGWPEPVRLAQNSLWILRLPFIYCGPGGAHLPPGETPVEDANNGRLFKAFIGTHEDYREQED